MLCADTGSREHTYTKDEMRLVQTITRLAALMLTHAQLQREHAEARANELALRQVNRRMQEFIGMICHELKTPLTVMKGNLQLAEQKMKRLARSEEGSSEVMRRLAPVQVLLERARSQINIQDRLVNDLLDASCIQAQTLKLVMEPCNLVSIVQEAVEDQRQMAPLRTIELEVPTEKIVPVYADADRIVQVLMNYLTNALNYSAPDRPVGVHLSVEGHRACVSVHDEGPGLPLTEQQRIWERFYRVPGVGVHSEAGISGGGLGLGLYICRAMIEQHHGQVGVQSSPGEGSTFWFTLPLREIDLPTD
jgi:signal transduction histidine kinase